MPLKTEQVLCKVVFMFMSIKWFIRNGNDIWIYNILQKLTQITKLITHSQTLYLLI